LRLPVIHTEGATGITAVAAIMAAMGIMEAMGIMAVAAGTLTGGGALWGGRTTWALGAIRITGDTLTIRIILTRLVIMTVEVPIITIDKKGLQVRVKTPQ